MSSPAVSIIICTRNRSQALGRTLASLGGLNVPSSWRVEVMVVDNGSNDDTRQVVSDAALHNPLLRYVPEPRRGQCHARNTGLASMAGDIVLFTDDDVFPSRNWLCAMVGPILEGRYDAVVGKLELSSELQRDWLTPFHRCWLAAPDQGPDAPLELVGANMGFHRRVLEKVPGFDPELGPGALGFGDDTLFSWQVQQAGARIGFVQEATVAHCPEVSRLRRRAWLDAGANRGRTQAFLLHHWRHGSLRHPEILRSYLKTKLRLRRRLQPPPPLDAEGGLPWEISYVGGIAKCEQYLLERSRPPKYAKHGLQPLSPGNSTSLSEVPTFAQTIT